MERTSGSEEGSGRTRSRRDLLVAILIAAAAVAGCKGDPGTNGTNGTSCTLTHNGDGTSTIRCTDGTSVVVSSTQGARADEMTAILLVTNADLLIRLATPPGQRGGVVTFGAGVGGGGFGVLNIP